MQNIYFLLYQTPRKAELEVSLQIDAFRNEHMQLLDFREIASSMRVTHSASCVVSEILADVFISLANNVSVHHLSED